MLRFHPGSKTARDLEVGAKYTMFNIKKVGISKLEFHPKSYAKLEESTSSSAAAAENEWTSRNLSDAPDGLSYKTIIGKLVKIQDKNLPSGNKCKEVTFGDMFGQFTLTIWKDAFQDFSFPLGSILRLRKYSIKNYRSSLNGPKSLEWRKRISSAQKVTNSATLIQFESVEYVSNENCLSGTIIEITEARGYKSCPNCRKKLTEGSKSCSKCFRAVDYMQAEHDYTIHFVMQEAETEDFYYFQAYRNALKDFETNQFILHEDDSKNKERIQESLSTVINQDVKIKYRVIDENNKVFISLEFL